MMPVVRGGACAGSWSGSHDHRKGSERAKLTGASKAANERGEMKRQKKELLR
jgi:hypothetical protein